MKRAKFSLVGRRGEKELLDIKAEVWFWPRIKPASDGECWLWTGSIGSPHGYGIAYHNKRRYRAHRLAWALKHGPIPRGRFVCHHCDTRACCRDEHLFLGTHRANMRDMNRKDRRVRGEQSPHAKLTAACVVELRRLRADGMSWQRLADRFGVSVAAVRQVLDGVSWSHVQEEWSIPF
jgi:HNH endonuclease